MEATLRKYIDQFEFVKCLGELLAQAVGGTIALEKTNARSARHELDAQARDHRCFENLASRLLGCTEVRPASGLAVPSVTSGNGAHEPSSQPHLRAALVSQQQSSTTSLVRYPPSFWLPEVSAVPAAQPYRAARRKAQA